MPEPVKRIRQVVQRMSPHEPFTFGIPLIARAAARNWPLVEGLLALTLASVQAQTDRDSRIVIAGHDRPEIAWDEDRVTFLAADWPAEAVRPDNLDSGRKKHAIDALVMRSGGGLLMFLDADDWVDVHLVERARAAIGPDHIGGLIATGFATDFRNLRCAALPHPKIFAGGFHRVCGSSTVARLRPEDPDPLRRDPHRILHEHYRWVELAREYEAELVRLPVSGNYVINTSESHSEIHGPYTEWRRGFSAAGAREGNPLDDAFTARFGLTLAEIRMASRTLLPDRGTAAVTASRGGWRNRSC